jgi:hypothetical protein
MPRYPVLAEEHALQRRAIRDDQIFERVAVEYGVEGIDGLSQDLA